MDTSFKYIYIAQKNYLCNVGQGHRDMSLQENKLCNGVLIWICLNQHCTIKLSLQCGLAMLTHSPQTNLQRDIICNLSGFCLSGPTVHKEISYLCKVNFGPEPIPPKKITNINQCLTTPANRCLTSV